jgi:hypothetical protein
MLEKFVCAEGGVVTLGDTRYKIKRQHVCALFNNYKTNIIAVRISYQ